MGDLRIAVLVSGGGSNLEAILQAQETGQLPGARVMLVVSSRTGVKALERAHQRGIATAVFERAAYPNEDAVQAAVLDSLVKAKIDVVCLAGYLKKLNPDFVKHFHHRIMNIHPALLPKHGGPGMYGHHVHEAVLAAGEKESGCTVHVVDEEYDHGPILAQARVPVLPNDTAATLAARVLELEHKLYPKTLRAFCEKLAAKGVETQQ